MDIRNDKELQYSLLTVFTVMSAPPVFVVMQNREVPTAISLITFFAICILGFFFQHLRLRETNKKRLPFRMRNFSFKIGDEVRYQGHEFVVLKYGFNHYYLRDVRSEQVILVKKARIELAQQAS